jgi:hypothetical protein
LRGIFAQVVRDLRQQYAQIGRFFLQGQLFRFSYGDQVEIFHQPGEQNQVILNGKQTNAGWIAAAFRKKPVKD